MNNSQIAFDYMNLLECHVKQNYLRLDEINKHIKNINVLLGDRITPWPEDFQQILKEAPDLNDLFVLKKEI